MREILNQATQAFHDDDAPSLRALLDLHPQLKAVINEPIGPFDSPAIVNIRSRAMLDVLLDAGADINARSRWWAGGFGLLDLADPDLASYAIQKGATVTAHAAARLGLLGDLKKLLAVDPSLVHARGGDGQTPLHFASTVDIAELLLDHSADIDARDLDHLSTPAQYMVRRRQPIARFLVEHGARTDLLLVAALGDLDRARAILDADPEQIRLRVSPEYFPMVGGQPPNRPGGTIYQWELGWYVSAHEVAKNFGHTTLLDLLMQRSPDDLKLIAACRLHDDALVASLTATHPNLVAHLRPADRNQLAHAAHNNDLAALRLMLKAGWPVDGLTQHSATALHWAAFHGNTPMAELLIQHKAPLERRDADYQSTPLGWAIYGSEHGYSRQVGDFPATVRALLAAGAAPPQEIAGSPRVREVLARHVP